MYDEIKEKYPSQFETHYALENLKKYKSNLNNNASLNQYPEL